MTGPKREIIFEIRRVGDYLKVSAIDPATNTEVSIVGKQGMDHTALRAMALKKLTFVIEKARGGK